MKSTICKLFLVLFCALSFGLASSIVEAHGYGYHHHGWRHGYHWHSGYYGGFYGPTYYQGGCRWVGGFRDRYGYWHPAHRACWR